MSRVFFDRDLRQWEAFASTGRHGLPRSAYVVFHCLTERDLEPRYWTSGGDKAAAERFVASATDPELLDALDGARSTDEAPDAADAASTKLVTGTDDQGAGGSLRSG